MSIKPKPTTEYTIESLPHYDSVGNCYSVKKTYSYKPTHDDSVRFEKESSETIQKMIDSTLVAK